MLHTEQKTPDTPPAPVITVNKNGWWKASARLHCVCRLPANSLHRLLLLLIFPGRLSVNQSNQVSVLADLQPTASHCKRPAWLINVSGQHVIFPMGFIRRALTAPIFHSPSLVDSHEKCWVWPRRFQFSGKLKLCAGSLALLPSETRLATQGSERRLRLLAIYPSFVSSSFWLCEGAGRQSGCGDKNKHTKRTKQTMIQLITARPVDNWSRED